MGEGFGVRRSINDPAVVDEGTQQPSPSGWQKQADRRAPESGESFLAVVSDEVRVVSYGKTSHVPMYGYCLADQGAEDFDLCAFDWWQPMPSLPAHGGAAGSPSTNPAADSERLTPNPPSEPGPVAGGGG
jgi:hypothetical protein